MSPTLVFLTGLVAGTLCGAATCAVLARRSRLALGRTLATRVAPILERRAAALGIHARSSPSVDVGHDGDLVLHGTDAIEQVLRLADAIEEQEHAQLGYVDTIRVSKDEVDANMPVVQSGPRARLHRS